MTDPEKSASSGELPLLTVSRCLGRASVEEMLHFLGKSSLPNLVKGAIYLRGQNISGYSLWGGRRTALAANQSVKNALLGEYQARIQESVLVCGKNPS